MVIDTEQKLIEYVNAGHPTGIAFVDDHSIELLQQSCEAIGLFNRIKVNKHTIRYKKDINIFLYTDGLTDAMEHGSEISIDHLIRLINNEKNLEPTALIKNIIPVTAPSIQKDDICLVQIKSK